MPHDAPRAHALPALAPLFFLLAVAVLAQAAHDAPLVVAALAALGAAPLLWRLLTRRWRKGDVLKGLGAGLAASDTPLLVGGLASLWREECRTSACLDVMMAGAGLVPWAGLAGMVLYWALAAPAPRS